MRGWWGLDGPLTGTTSGDPSLRDVYDCFSENEQKRWVFSFFCLAPKVSEENEGTGVGRRPPFDSPWGSLQRRRRQGPVPVPPPPPPESANKFMGIVSAADTGKIRVNVHSTTISQRQGTHIADLSLQRDAIPFLQNSSKYEPAFLITFWLLNELFSNGLTRENGKNGSYVLPATV